MVLLIASSIGANSVKRAVSISMKIALDRIRLDWIGLDLIGLDYIILLS